MLDKSNFKLDFLERTKHLAKNFFLYFRRTFSRRIPLQNPFAEREGSDEETIERRKDWRIHSKQEERKQLGTSDGRVQSRHVYQ